MFAILLLPVASNRLSAHDPPEDYFDRNLTVRIEPGCVRVIYRLELSQVSLFYLPKDDDQIKTSVPGRSALEASAMERFKVLVPDLLIAFLNRERVKWEVERTSIRQEGSTHFHLILRADWKPKAGGNTFEISETNFRMEPGPFRLKFDLADAIEITAIDEPREFVSKGVCPEERQSAQVTFQLTDEAIGQSASPAPILEESPSPSEPSIWERLRRDDLAGLLATSYGFWLLMLIALIHGAGHSLMPGHGKTMVAAYLVGERGTPWHAVLLGIVTTLTHTSAAIGIAIVIRFTTAKAESINSLLLFIGGLMMASIGLWLFLQRIAGRSDHVHLFDMGHAHSHGETPPSSAKMGTLRLVLLGIAGGVIPCWGAILWVIGCIATSQFWLALPIVLAFSVGLSSVLILLGLSVVYSGRIGSSRWGERAWFKKGVRWLPVFGATVVIGIGLFMCATSGIAR